MAQYLPNYPDLEQPQTNAGQTVSNFSQVWGGQARGARHARVIDS